MGGKRSKSKARTAAQNSGEGMMAANMAELVERWRKVHGRLADAVAMVAAAKAVAPAAACLIFRGREGFPLARHELYLLFGHRTGETIECPKRLEAAMGRPPKYTPEFRREAVEYCVSSGRTYAEVAASLGVNESTLAHWVRDARRDEPSVGERRDEASELRARVRELEMENEFLKKAAAFFAARQA